MSESIKLKIMRPRLIIFAFLLGFLFNSYEASALVKTVLNSSSSSEYYLDITPEDLMNKSVRRLYVESGKTYTLEERFKLRVLKRALKKSKHADLSIAYEDAKVNSFAMISFISGIFSWSLFLFSIGFIFLPCAFVFGIIALKQIKKSRGKQRGKALAKWGIVLGLIAIVSLGLYVLPFLLGN